MRRSYGLFLIGVGQQVLKLGVGSGIAARGAGLVGRVVRVRGYGFGGDARRRQPAEVGALQEVLAQFVRTRKCDGVLAGEAGGTEAFARLLGGADHAVFGNVSQRIRSDGLGDFLDGGAVGDQFSAGREVDAVEAGPLDGRG